MDKSKYNGNNGRHSCNEFQPNWSDQKCFMSPSGAIDNSKYNGNNGRHAWDVPNWSSQTHNNYVGSFQMADKPKHNDPKPWNNANGSNQTRSSGHLKNDHKIKPRQIPPCGFCRNNKEAPECYNTHSLNDRYDRVSCPRLFNYVCPLCKATGFNAHTIIYCPLNMGQRD